MEAYSTLDNLKSVNENCEFKFSNNLKSSIRIFMVDLMLQVERWDLRCDNFVFHTDVEHLIKECVIDPTHSYQIWGAQVLFTKDIELDKAFAVSNMLYEDNRHIAQGIFPSASLKKYYDLKAFW